MWKVFENVWNFRMDGSILRGCDMGEEIETLNGVVII
jgi:hypothetical protein